MSLNGIHTKNLWSVNALFCAVMTSCYSTSCVGLGNTLPQCYVRLHTPSVTNHIACGSEEVGANLDTPPLSSASHLYNLR